ncbi:MAG: diguanylate cyclase [Chromatiales bacterium]|nr:diguanylate cyclase [Chromatiales bacterium]MDX9768115.1 diguanylate cyclase [Ectothiorhodospiraceae bacterium]
MRALLPWLLGFGLAVAASPAFAIDDLWQRYRWEIVGTIGGALILSLATGLWLSRRRLLQERARVAAQMRELHASHELLTKISSQVPGMIYQYLLRPDGSSSFPYASDTIRDIYAVSPQQARDDAALVFRRIHPDDLERVQAGIRRSAATLAPWLQEYRIQSPETGLRWCEDRAMPERQADGGTLWHGFVTDVTPRKLIEARLADAAAEKQRLLASLGEGVYGIDHQGICTFINPSALDMLGYAEDEVLGHDQHRLFHHHREDGSDYPTRECPISRTLADARPRYVDDWFIRRDGRGFPVSLLISPIEEDGVCTGAVVAFRDITERLRLEENLKALATTDALTGLPNRRHLLEQMERELARVRRHPERPAAVLMADLDHFKRVNDKYGHAAGDMVLRHFAATLREAARKSDLAGRLGGEEFVLLLPDTPIDKARLLAERLRETIETARVDTGNGRVRYTVSIGITAMTADDAAVDPALARADAALYRAKQGGRNRVEV